MTSSNNPTNTQTLTSSPIDPTKNQTAVSENVELDSCFCGTLKLFCRLVTWFYLMFLASFGYVFYLIFKKLMRRKRRRRGIILLNCHQAKGRLEKGKRMDMAPRSLDNRDLHLAIIAERSIDQLWAFDNIAHCEENRQASTSHFCSFYLRLSCSLRLA